MYDTNLFCLLQHWLQVHRCSISLSGKRQRLNWVQTNILEPTVDKTEVIRFGSRKYLHSCGSFLNLRHVTRLWPYVTPNAAKTFLHVFVTSRLDYSNALVAGSPPAPSFKQSSSFRTLPQPLCLPPPENLPFRPCLLTPTPSPTPLPQSRAPPLLTLTL